MLGGGSTSGEPCAMKAAVRPGAPRKAELGDVFDTLLDTLPLDGSNCPYQPVVEVRGCEKMGQTAFSPPCKHLIQFGVR